MPAVTMDRLVKDLADCSRKFRWIVLCLVSVPAVIGWAWLLFPILEARNMGYPVWHFSCELGFLASGSGAACWIAERLSRGSSPSWIRFLMLVGFGTGAIALRFFGDFYWAFERGYFLD